MIKYLIPFLTSFILSIFFVCLSFLFFKKAASEKRQEDRHIHKRKNIFRWGGLAIILSFNAAILLNKDLYIPFGLWGIMLISLLILIIGIWDDIWELSWKTQLFLQSLVAGLVFLFGTRIQYLVDPFFGRIIQLNEGALVGISFLVGFIWILLLMNAMNWLDGIDGLSGGVAAIATLTIFFLSLKAEVNQPPMAIMAIILTGSILGFLVFNFNPGKILAGTAGSMFMGFSLAVLAIFSGTKIATTLLVLVIPLVDFLWVIWERWKNKKSIFAPDKKHLHYKLLELGWSQKRVVFVFYIITGVIAIIALNTRAIGKSITLILSVIIMATVLIGINKFSKSSGFPKARPSETSNFRTKILLLLVVLVVLSATLLFINKKYFNYSEYGNKLIQIKLGQEVFLAEVVDSQKKIEKGLSGRDSLCEKCAMLFLFNDSTKRNFWMKDMKFSLDLIWLKDNRIVQISSRIPYKSGKNEVAKSLFDTDKVIEINAGISEKLGLEVGDMVKL